MNVLKKIYHFLGSIYCAILLLTVTALLVVVGTFIESHTGSHRFAAGYIYSNPLFSLLLWGFFFNILISALRRWPFKIKHIPFLMTHFGLLMILGGCLIKNYYGLQGHMTLMEGAGSHRLTLPDSYSVVVEKRDESNPSNTIAEEYILTQSNLRKGYRLISSRGAASRFPNLSLKIVDYGEHSKETWKSWFKGDYAYVRGVPPVPVREFQNELPNPSGRAKLFPSEEGSWTIYALRGGEVPKILRALLLNRADVLIKDHASNALLARFPLNSLTEKEMSVGSLAISAELPEELLKGVMPKQVEIVFKLSKPDSPVKQKITLPLMGSKALENLHFPHVVPGFPALKIEIERDPAFTLLESENGDIALIALNEFGQLHLDHFAGERPSSIIVYDEGFGGYSVQTKIPFGAKSPSPSLLEESKLKALTENLRKLSEDDNQLSPPLHLLKETCRECGTDFVETFIDFLTVWRNSHRWLVNDSLSFNPALKKTLENLKWSSIPPAMRQSCIWLTNIMPTLEASMAQGHDFLGALKQMRWPLAGRLEKYREQLSGEPDALFEAFVQQLLSISTQWTEGEIPPPPALSSNAALLSAYFRIYGIDLQSLEASRNSDEAHDITTICAECAIVPVVESAEPLARPEDNIPKITLHVLEKNVRQLVSLAYDRQGTGLKWPLLHGKYRIRFQPNIRDIPYHLRLRNASQKNYPNTQRAQSYCCSLYVTDRAVGKTEEVEISMNNVYESPDGYRFYLSNISSSDNSQVKKIQLVVNYDPARYLLTYPGGVVVAIGIFLLFWMRPYRFNR